MKRLLVSLCALTMLAGCAQPLSGVKYNANSGGSVTVKSNTAVFQAVSVKDLLSDGWRTPGNKGKLVSFVASFDRLNYSNGAYTLYEGYKLWDRAGNAIICSNINSSRFKGEAVNRQRDFNDGAKGSLLTHGKFVEVRGEYAPAVSIDGSMKPAIDIYAIEGVPVSDYIKK